MITMVNLCRTHHGSKALQPSLFKKIFQNFCFVNLIHYLVRSERIFGLTWFRSKNWQYCYVPVPVPDSKKWKQPITNKIQHNTRTNEGGKVYHVTSHNSQLTSLLPLSESVSRLNSVPLFYVFILRVYEHKKTNLARFLA